MRAYPKDKITKDGDPFWSLPKHPPSELKFNPKNELHARFVTAAACLWAKIFSIPLPENPYSLK